MEPLPPIPTPIEQRWREFRIQVLPIIFFICAVAALVFFWRNYMQPVSVVGEVEAVKSSVASLKDGTIVSLSVTRFDRVKKGQVIGQVRTANPELLTASLASIAADLKVMKIRIDLDRTRILDAFSRMKLNLLTEKVALNMARIHLVQAEKEFERMKNLFDDGIIPGGYGVGIAPSERDTVGFDVSARDRDALTAEVEDRSQLVAQYEKELERMQSAGAGDIPEQDNLMEETIRAKEKELEQTMAPEDLIAPIDGLVSLIYYRVGESVLRGTPIITIGATESDRIVGYLRQPIVRVPSIQDKVEIRTRGGRGLKATGQVIEIGAQMEPINPALISTDATRLELGLPILISLPEELRGQLRPGQVVDLSIQYSDKESS